SFLFWFPRRSLKRNVVVMDVAAVTTPAAPATVIVTRLDKHTVPLYQGRHELVRLAAFVLLPVDKALSHVVAHPGTALQQLRNTHGLRKNSVDLAVNVRLDFEHQLIVAVLRARLDL